MKLLEKCSLMALCALLGVLGVAKNAAAMPIHSTNGVTDPGAKLYIPLRPETSGGLGTVIVQAASGRRRPKRYVVGLKKDKVLLNVANPVSSGEVNMFSVFDLSSQLTEETPTIDPNSDMILTLIFKDLDFQPVVVRRKVDFSETITLTLVDSSGTPAAGASPLLIDKSNYMDFRQDVDRKGRPITKTNRKKATYELSLRRMFGADPQGWRDFIKQINISEDKELKLMVTMTSRMEFFGTRGRKKIRNTPERMRDALLFSVAPEPGTLSILALGGMAIAVRRKRRA